MVNSGETTDDVQACKYRELQQILGYLPYYPHKPSVTMISCTWHAHYARFQHDSCVNPSM